MSSNNDRFEASRLIDYVNESVDVEEDFHFLRFEFLQRVNIVNLQVELARMKSQLDPSCDVSSTDLDYLRVKLQQYGKKLSTLRSTNLGALLTLMLTLLASAIRDYQYLRDKKSLAKTEALDRKVRLQRYFHMASEISDPWESHYSYFKDGDDQSSTIDPVRGTFMRFLPSRLTFSRHEREARVKEYSEGKPPWQVSRFVDRLARFIVALTGGTFLVIPMILMTLNPSETKSLITVSVAVVIFSLILSFGIRVSNVETLVSTATYAAVLVVFVGTSTAN